MEKKKFRLNAVDVIIILLVLAAIGVFAYVFLGQRGDADEGKDRVKINYVLMVGEMRDVFAENVKVGDEFYEVETDKYLGKVTQVSSAVSRRTGTNRTTGEQVVSEIENRRDLFITLEAEADITDGLYMVSGVNIMIGNVLNFISPNLSQPSNIISLEVVE